MGKSFRKIHCAPKVNTLGFLPSNPRDSVVWLWQIHNMANVKLKGKEIRSCNI